MIQAIIQEGTKRQRRSRRRLSAGVGRGRVEEFEYLVHSPGAVLSDKSELGISGALGMIGICFLLGKEVEAHAALSPISEGDPWFLGRKDKIRRPPEKIHPTRRKTVIELLALWEYFANVVRNDYVAGMISLLTTLAMDTSHRRMCTLLAPLLLEATREGRLRDLVEAELPGALQAMEKIAAERG